MPSDYYVIQLCNTLSKKGTLRLLRELEKGHLKYSEIVPDIITKGQSTHILGELQDRKIITKAVHGYKKGQYTAYELTKDGKQLLLFFTKKFQPRDLIIDGGPPREDEK